VVCICCRETPGFSPELARPAGISSRVWPADVDDDLMARGVDIIGRTLATGRPPIVWPYLRHTTDSMASNHRGVDIIGRTLATGRPPIVWPYLRHIIIILIPGQSFWCCHHDSESLREFNQFTRWMQNSTTRPPTFGPSRRTLFWELRYEKYENQMVWNWEWVTCRWTRGPGGFMKL